MPAKTTPQSEDVNNPYGYSEMDWAAQLDPAYAAARADVRRLSVGEDGALSVKVKEFVVLGILASRGLQYGVEAHMRRALAHGATKEDLAPSGRTLLISVPDASPTTSSHSQICQR
jgi:alkylhydroperoxidase/carboxymuconolactone decarboxylase family protein YurZ